MNVLTYTLEPFVLGFIGSLIGSAIALRRINRMKKLDAAIDRGRFQRRGMRWWWVYDDGTHRKEIGPRWFRYNLMKEVVAWIAS